VRLLSWRALVCVTVPVTMVIRVRDVVSQAH
jgi:hypothetical protein